MPKQMIAELNPDIPVSGCFVVHEVELRPLSGKPGKYLHLILGDASGQVTARLWDATVESLQACPVGTPLLVRGTTQRYQEELQVKIQTLRPAKSGEYKEDELLPMREKNPEAQRMALAGWVEAVQQPHLAALLEAFFGDPAFLGPFLRAPAALRIHHAYNGGLLDHTLAVLRLLETTMVDHPGMDRDLLIAGALLHDVGKVETYVPQGLVFRISDAGRLLDHIILGERLVMTQAEAIPGFPPELALHLDHLIISHHGTRENGSPVLPMTPEAIALHHADNLDAQVQRFQELTGQSPPGERWTAYQATLGRSLFCPSRSPGDEHH
ncbi:MAG: HD domain-containing protein [bacterium]